MTVNSLVDIILTQVEGPLRAQLQSLPEDLKSLDKSWQHYVDSAPKLVVSKTRFAEILVEKLTKGKLPPESLAALPIEDLVIAEACREGDREALAYMEESVLQKLGPALKRAGKNRADVEDAMQILRERLFVGTNGFPPKIADYNGAGRLHSWVRVAGIRILQNLGRSVKREVLVDSSEVWERLLPPGHAQIEHLKSRYRDEFRQALSEAVHSLGDRNRVLLRQHFVENVPSTKLAALYKVHRATVSRWIVLAQEELLETTRAMLMTRLKISTVELESVLKLIQSQFDTRIGEFLSN